MEEVDEKVDETLEERKEGQANKNVKGELRVEEPALQQALLWIKRCGRSLMTYGMAYESCGGKVKWESGESAVETNRKEDIYRGLPRSRTL